MSTGTDYLFFVNFCKTPGGYLKWYLSGPAGPIERGDGVYVKDNDALVSFVNSIANEWGLVIRERASHGHPLKWFYKLMEIENVPDSQQRDPRTTFS